MITPCLLHRADTASQCSAKRQIDVRFLVRRRLRETIPLRRSNDGSLTVKSHEKMTLNIEYYEKELEFWRGETLRLRKQIDELHDKELKRLTAQIEGTKIGAVKKWIANKSTTDVLKLSFMAILGLVALYAILFAPI